MGDGLDKPLYMKCKEWEYEQEHRLVVTSGSEIFYDPSSIRSITIGQKMSSENRAELLQVVEKLNLQDKLHVADIDTETFQLKIVPYGESRFN